MSPIAIVAAVLLAGVVLADRPTRKPGNLTPIQLISALGAWTLVLANASAMAIAIRDRSPVLLCSASTTVAIVLVSMLRQNARSISGREAPQSLTLVVDDLEQLLGGAPRLGMNALDTVVVDGRCPGIGVAVERGGRVIVRVRRDVAKWLESHRRAGGAGAEAVASFARFIVLHEIAHVLNGDHRTFRFVRSVLIAQLAWLAGAVAAAVILMIDRGASARPLVVAASIILLFVAQSLVAKRFIAERERWADWRAMQTLPPADVARLLERRGRRRGVGNPTELEKLMTDLKVQATPHRDKKWLARLTALAWPEGDDVHHRSENVRGDLTGRGPQPVLWAALIGMQCGFLLMSLALAVMLAVTPWFAFRPETLAKMTVAIVLWISAPAGIFCGLRVDPALMSVRKLGITGRRIIVSLAFHLAFAASAVVLSGFHAHFGVALVMDDPLFEIPALTAMQSVFSIAISTVFGRRDGGGSLQVTPRWPWVVLFPVLATIVLVQVPLSLIASQLMGAESLRSGAWIPLAAMSLAVGAVSCSMARSTSSVLRTIVPMALFVTPAPVYGFRLFWHDFYIDLPRTTLVRAAAVVTAVQLATIPFFVMVATLFLPVTLLLLAGQPMLTVVLFGMIGVMVPMLFIPDRYDTYRGPSAGLLDTERLQLFERLLAATRTAGPAAASSLSATLARWLRNDRFLDALLPRPDVVWPLAPLLVLVGLAGETGETAMLLRWRTRIEQALRQIIADDAVAIAPRQPPSLYWTVLAASIIDKVGLLDAFPFDRMLDRIETLLDERVEHGTVNLLADIVAAWQLLRRHGRPGPDPQRVRRFARSSSLVSRPLLRQSLVELVELAELTGDVELRERLGPVVRSRIWEGLQLNARKDVLPLLDCYLAAARLGEDDARHAAAGRLVTELAERVSDELSAVVSDTERAVNTQGHRTKA